MAADDAVVRPDDEGEPALVLQGPGVFAGGREQGGLPRPPGHAHLAVQDLREGRGLSAARVAPEAAVGDVLPAVAVQRDHHRREHIMMGSKCIQYIHAQEGGLISSLWFSRTVLCGPDEGGDAESILIGPIHSQWPGSMEIVLVVGIHIASC